MDACGRRHCHFYYTVRAQLHLRSSAHYQGRSLADRYCDGQYWGRRSFVHDDGSFVCLNDGTVRSTNVGTVGTGDDLWTLDAATNHGLLDILKLSASENIRHEPLDLTSDDYLASAEENVTRAS